MTHTQTLKLCGVKKEDEPDCTGGFWTGFLGRTFNGVSELQVWSRAGLEDGTLLEIDRLNP